MTFEIYPWHTKQWQKLVDARDKGRIPHALLLNGRPGLGMDDFAAGFAAVLSCNTGAAAPCGECRSCVLLAAGTHPDIIRVEPEEPGKQIKVDAIRELIEFTQLSSQYARYRIVIIAPAEAMNRSAANSLLKTLEEPPAGVIFMLLSHRPASLPVTIRSRCQKITFAADDSGPTLSWLMGKTGYDEAAAADLLNLSQGRPVYALQLKESEITGYQNQVIKDLDELARRPADIVSLAKKWQDYGTSDVFQWLLSFLGIMTRMKTLVPGPGSDDKSALIRDLQQLANRLDLSQLAHCYDLAFRNYQLAIGPYNLNQTGLLEEFIVYWQSLNTANGRN
ncbi:MAG: DNA polymerase III subunit delta' [Gammaproteobacteria bacterium]